MATVADTNVRVQVNGTTFSATYEAVGSRVELTSADFGDHSAELGDATPQAVANRILRLLAEQAVRRGGVPFMRDDGTVADPVEE